jgi:heme-degrading monooxygenase HmoA
MLRDVSPGSTESLDIILGGLTMYARVTTAQINPEDIEEGIKIYKESVVPAAKKQKGFVAISLMINPETGDILSIGYWESEEDAVATEKNLFYQEHVAKFIPFFVQHPIRDGYEVIIQEK